MTGSGAEKLMIIPAVPTWAQVGEVVRNVYEETMSDDDQRSLFESSGEVRMAVPFDETEGFSRWTTSIWRVEGGEMYRYSDKTSQVISEALGLHAFVFGCGMISGDDTAQMLLTVTDKAYETK